MRRFVLVLVVVLLGMAGLSAVATAGADDELSPGCQAVNDVTEPLITHEVSDTRFARGEVATVRFFAFGRVSVSGAFNDFDWDDLWLNHSPNDSMSYAFHGDETGIRFSGFPLAGLGAGHVSCDRMGEHHPTCAGRPATIAVFAPRGSRVDGIRGEVIVTDAGPDRVFAGPGDDVVCGGDGADIIDGGPGNDTLMGQAGPDGIGGGPGADIVLGQGGPDGLGGGPGADLVQGGSGPDGLVGGPGDDDLFGNKGRDSIWARGGDDFVHGGPGDDTLKGGHGTDTIWGAGNFDKCWGEHMRCEVKHRTRPTGGPLS